MTEPIRIQLPHPMYRDDRPRAIFPKGARCHLQRRPDDLVFRVQLVDGPPPKGWPDLKRWLDRLQKDEQ